MQDRIVSDWIVLQEKTLSMNTTLCLENILSVKSFRSFVVQRCVMRKQ